jgi:hypothetical protein
MSHTGRREAPTPGHVQAHSRVMSTPVACHGAQPKVGVRVTNAASKAAGECLRLTVR